MRPQPDKPRISIHIGPEDLVALDRLADFMRPKKPKLVSAVWTQALREIHEAILAQSPQENPVDELTCVFWVEQLTPYDVRFLRTLRIGAQ